ncbi:MAG: alpha/beta hydrolase, partial [Blastocatellia bacterium]
MLPVLKRFASVSIFWCLIAGSALAQTQSGSCPLKFHITLSKEVASQTLQGRLLMFMSDSTQPKEMLDAGFIPGETWIAGMDVDGLTPGGSISFDPDVKAYPHPFSHAKTGTYQFMALLDTDHEYVYGGPDNNSYYSSVVKVENVNPSSAAPVELTIEKRFKGRSQPADTENVKLARFQSPALTRFWGRPIYVEGGVVLPPSYNKDRQRRYPTVYVIHGFGGDHTAAWRQGPQLAKQMSDGKIPEMIWVFLNGHLPTGHHEFADSANNGPWGEALTREYIPYLEKTYRMVARPYARFVTGHSSGGWSSLWLQVTYPDFFGGTWSTSPDPVD